MSDAMRYSHHGRIACGTVSVSNLEHAIVQYRDFLHQELAETGYVNDDLAQSWGAPAAAGARYAVLRPNSESVSMLRLVETPAAKAHVPAMSFGWNAFELTVRDVFQLATELEASDFNVVGPPKLVDGFTSFIPMQAFGPNGEVLFLNQVNHSDDDAELPKTTDDVGEIFIVVVASPDRQRTVDEHVKCLNLQEAATHSLRYSLVNRAFDFPTDTLQTISMVQNGRIPYGQVDQYPKQAKERAQQPGHLPAGNAMVSVLVECIDDLPLDGVTVGGLGSHEGVVYQGRRTQVIRGSATELIELIEIEATH